MSYVVKKCEALQIKIYDRLVSDLVSLISHWLSEAFDFESQNASPAKCEATTLQIDQSQKDASWEIKFNPHKSNATAVSQNI